MSKKIALLVGILIIVVVLAGLVLKRFPLQTSKPSSIKPNAIPKLPSNVKTVEQALLKYDSYASLDEQKLIANWMNQGLRPSATSSAILALIKKVAVAGDTIKINTKCEPSPVVLQLISSQKVKIDNTSQPSIEHIFSLGSDHYRLEAGKIIDASISAALHSTLIPFNCDNPGGVFKGFIYLP